MMRTMDQTVAGLRDLGVYSERRIDAAVDCYLVGFGAQTASMRIELAETFRLGTPASELAQRAYQRILRRDA